LQQITGLYIETALDSLILRSKINESSAVSNDYLARSAEKRLFAQPLPNKIPRGEAADTLGK